ncbi:MAG: ComEC/Rec2 family competence protein, partial [Eubacterium sp.]|nr:ComEC/Rec2 family competence protein [Eubacterium sp.]
MRRPLMTVGALLLLGEVAGANVLIRNDIFIFAAAAALIMIYISNRYDAPQKKCSYLLLFFVFIAGGMIGISSNHAVFERKMNASGCSIVCEIMSTEEKGFYIYLIVRDSGGEKHLIKMAEMKDAELLPGYYIEVEGSYEGFSPASNPGGYSEKDYYEGIGLRDIISVVRISDTGRRDYLRLFLYKVKKQMKEGLYLTMAEREAGVVAAMILGERNGLDKELKTMYQESGIAHILAISSLHVMLIGSFLIKIFRMLGVKRDKASYLTILILMLYGMMTGFAASTLRAAVMISLSLMAARLRRKEDMATSLCIAMIIIGITNPHILSGAGNILSLTAVIGVMAGRYIYDSIFGKDRFLRIKKKYRKYVKGMIKGVIMSVSINAVMLPVIIYNYYEVPVFGMILNLVVIPLLTVVVGAGFVAGILGMVSGAFGGNYMGDIFLWCGRAAGFASEMILRMYELLCKISIKIPFSRVVSGHTDLLHVSIYYLLLGIFI